MARFVTVVNRTNRVLHGVWDGRHEDIPVGKSAYMEQNARAFKRQNVLMGSENPMTGDVTYLLGIEEFGDPVTPLEENPAAIERWDRSKLPGAKPSEVVPGDNGLYSLGRTLGSGGLPADAGFTPA